MLCVRRCWIVVGAILWEGETLDSVQGMVQVYVIFPVLNFRSCVSRIFVKINRRPVDV